MKQVRQNPAVIAQEKKGGIYFLKGQNTMAFLMAGYRLQRTYYDSSQDEPQLNKKWVNLQANPFSRNDV